MNVLLLSPRFPWPPYTGDRLRATIWLEALSRIANVTLIAPDGRQTAPHERQKAEGRRQNREKETSSSAFCLLPSAFHAAPRSLLNAAHARSFNQLLTAPYDWKGAIELAKRETRFDASVVLLSRLDPLVRAYLPGGPRILDAVDSLRRSMDERARESSPLTRWFWRAEARRMGRAEQEAARVYDRVVVVSEEDCRELNAIAVPNGVTIAPLGDAPRAFDFAFWGRLAYFANDDAATWLLEEIWPAIRARLPRATLFLGGADVPTRLRAAHGRDGITVQSPVPDIATLTRNVKVALFPVRYGTGQSNKVLEAAEGACAIVATTKAMRGLDALAPHTLIADDAAGLARAAVDALDKPAMPLRIAVEQHYAREQTLQRLAALVEPVA